VLSELEEGTTSAAPAVTPVVGTEYDGMSVVLGVVAAAPALVVTLVASMEYDDGATDASDATTTGVERLESATCAASVASVETVGGIDDTGINAGTETAGVGVGEALSDGGATSTTPVIDVAGSVLGLSVGVVDRTAPKVLELVATSAEVFVVRMLAEPADSPAPGAGVMSEPVKGL
jgi:hypothetical protein